jgi:hypothetical protein
MPTVNFNIEHYRVLTGAQLELAREDLGVRVAAVIECGGKSAALTIAAVPAGETVPENRGGPDSTGVIFIPSTHYSWYLDLLRNEGPVMCHLDLAWPRYHRLTTGMEAVGSTESHGAGAIAAPNLHGWLVARPHFRNALIWDEIAYDSWDDQQRRDLRDTFEAAWRHESASEAPDPPANVAVQLSEEETRQALRGSDAWKIYIGYVGHCLAVESAGRLPWSIANWTTDRLRYLLDAGEMFISRPDGFEINESVHGGAVPCGASRAWRFLLGNGLVRATPIATVGRVLEWCRDNLVHFSGGSTMNNFRAHWHYGGFPPVSRVIDGTVRDASFEPLSTARLHYTFGCGGTAGFLKVVLRAANVPVKIIAKPDGMPWESWHVIPAFPSIGRYLTHGDDPYSQFVTTALPLYPGEELLITNAAFEELFGAGVPRSTQSRNVGNRPRELALQHLPLYLLRMYCADLHAGLDHASGSVFAEIERLGLSVEQLEAMRLWERMNEKLAGLGGCDALPPGVVE